MSRRYLSSMTFGIIISLLVANIALPIHAVEAQEADNTKAEEYNPDMAKEDELSSSANAGEIINTVVGYLSAILAGLFVLMMIVGAIWYMVFPDPGKKQEGMKIIQSAIVAGVFALLSYAIWNILKAVL